MGFPDQKTLDEMRSKLKNIKGTKAFNKEDATPLESLRFEICQTLLKKLRQRNLQTEKWQRFVKSASLISLKYFIIV